MDDRESKIDPSHYKDLNYFKRERLYSFVEQIELIKRYATPQSSILEVGIGSGVLKAAVKKMFGFNITTLDINAQLHPDIVADISSFDLNIGKSYDLVCCFEVLEHMPFEQSCRAMNNIKKMANKHILLSLPDMRYFLSFNGFLFGNDPYKYEKVMSGKRFTRKSKTYSNDHFWEIGMKLDTINYSAKHVRKNLFQGANLIEDYRCPAVPWHHYYVIQI